MLENISSFFLLELFSYLSEEKKLKILKYNKSLQNKIKLNIKDYKIYSGRYIYYTSQNEGEEYDSFDNEIRYIGEYLNGERNGKGYEYNIEGTLIFEGEYFKGKKWNGKGYDGDGNFVYELKEGKGYVKECGSFGELIYEGEYLNGERNGKGKEYKDEGQLVFEGEYFYGKRWNGKGYDENGNIAYELKNGKGFVKEYYCFMKFENEGTDIMSIMDSKYDKYNDLIFEGEYLNGKRWNGKMYNIKNTISYELKKGKGYLEKYTYDHKLKFRGEYINGKKNGEGTEYDQNYALLFYGEYLNGKRWNGQGRDGDFNKTYELKNGEGYVKEFDYGGNLLYEGEYKNGVRNGKGKQYKDGDLLYDGEFLNGKLYKGKGKEYFCFNLMYEGEYMNGIRNGKGKEYNPGDITFEGEFFKGEEWNGKAYDKDGNFVYELKDGKGFVKEYNYGGDLQFEGEYLNGRKYAKGKLYDNGKVIYEGELSNGLKNGKGKEFDKDGKLLFEGEYCDDKMEI